jgi:hypothetical protein
MVETYRERVCLSIPATEEGGPIEGEDGPPRKYVEIRHRCGEWVRKDMAYCGRCGQVLRRRDGSLI